MKSIIYTPVSLQIINQMSCCKIKLINNFLDIQQIDANRISNTLNVVESSSKFINKLNLYFQVNDLQIKIILIKHSDS